MIEGKVVRDWADRLAFLAAKVGFSGELSEIDRAFVFAGIQSLACEMCEAAEPVKGNMYDDEQKKLRERLDNSEETTSWIDKDGVHRSFLNPGKG